MQRREFLGAVTVTAAVPLLAEAQAPEALQFERPPETVKGDMRYRPLGQTGELVSMIGVGGHHIGRQKDEKESIEIIRKAIDAGVNFLDNCWDYHDGLSEVRMGKALLDGYRQKAFLMTKIDARSKDAAAKQIDESLRRLQTDVIDLMQYHETLRFEDPDRVFADGGAHEAMVAARKAGKIRFIGFTGHKDPEVHLRMLDVARQHGFKFDTAQMPLNVMDAHFRSFGQKVVPVLLKEKIGVLGMKSMAAGMILKSGTVTPIECLHYAMNLPTSTVITGIDSLKILDQNLNAVKSFKPLSNEELAALLKKTAVAAAHGEFEKFKTTNVFDGTAQHPEWLGPPDKGAV